MAIVNDTVKTILEELGIDAEHTNLSLETLAAVDSRYLRDLKLNVKKFLFQSENVNAKEAALLAYAVAVNEKNTVLEKAFAALAGKHGAGSEEIAEMVGMTSLLNANNVFYRFRHFMKGNTFYSSTPASIRMNIMMNPVSGKEFFELGSLVVSALNGCEMCVTSHEASLRQLGTTEARIYEAIRLGAVIKSLTVVVNQF